MTPNSQTSAPQAAPNPRMRAARSAVIPLLGAFVLLLLGRALAAGVLASVGLVLLVAGLLFPAVAAALERATQAVGHAVGYALTRILLVPMYGLVFATGHLLIALLRKDPLGRRFPTSAPTYWRPRPAATRPDRYRQQF
jgi:hypothetical protein